MQVVQWVSPGFTNQRVLVRIHPREGIPCPSLGPHLTCLALDSDSSRVIWRGLNRDGKISEGRIRVRNPSHVSNPLRRTRSQLERFLVENLSFVEADSIIGSGTTRNHINGSAGRVCTAHHSCNILQEEFSGEYHRRTKHK